MDKPYKIFGESLISDDTKDQFFTVMDQDYVKKGALMPDAHLGYAMPIGSVVETDQTIVPSFVGYDIGCFVGSTKISIVDKGDVTLKELYDQKTSNFPVFSVDSKGKLVIGFADCVKLTRKNAHLLKITFDNNDQVICTPDHLFYLDNMVQVNACKLKKGLILKSFKRSFKAYKDSFLKTSKLEPLHKTFVNLSKSKYNNSLINSNISKDSFINSIYKEILTSKYITKDNLKIKEVLPIDYTEDVYCLTVNKYHNFMLSSGCIVHNCGMSSINTGLKLDTYKEHLDYIFKTIYQQIPVGVGRKYDNISRLNEEYTSSFENTGSFENSSHIFKEFYYDKGRYQLGTLGDGNHFIEIGHDKDDNIWITVHSGSRGQGHTIASHYMRLASSDNNIEGYEGFDINTNNGKMYISDMNACLDYAYYNRELMIYKVYEIIKSLSLNSVGGTFTSLDGLFENNLFINRHHNHAEVKSNSSVIHRKGATHAEKDMLGVIPGSMATGCLIVRGKGNPDSLFSSSHGAGRVSSRNKIRKLVDMELFKESMRGIVAKVDESTKDESIFAYKNIFEVMRQQRDLVEILYLIKPIINIKG